ncbi:N-acetyl sugar amidotransferase [Algoriphagus aquaeductus]|uniref:N-acetyl sugar amidotransferase n=1 Tax=Algoriphagus aquaeductus TaxID=475299 RepID=A0A326RU26_9BACT|nr:N-acetyl sugar amidotransferase [Algoriphagus aquaeductus]PZV79108.1 N-acetyl sugar amidotransferase [Algoriphagus aquaeductus]
MKICTRCIYDDRTPSISFDEEGVCNYCKQIDSLLETYKTGTLEGEQTLFGILDEIKKKGKGKKYDCVIGVSGGTDSSYLLIKAKEWGLRPLAVHYDNTWDSSIATENIRKVTSKLKVDLYTYVIDNKEADDIFRSFLLAGVPEFDASTDIGFVQVLRSAAAKYGIKYILEGHSFMAEGISPQGKNYFDGKYIESIHKKYGRLKMKTYPNMTFFQFMKWAMVYRQQFIRPLWYISYSKPEARKILTEQTGWTYYGGHHLENRSTSFLHTVYNPQKFGIDNRNWSLSAEARTGVISREEALEIYNTPIQPDPELITYVKKRLELTDQDYDDIMKGPKRSFRDFKTYKKRFENLRPLFFILAKANLVPMSFYLKYCFPMKSDDNNS